MIKKLILFAIVFILLPNILNAQLVIKSIDEEGCPPYDSDCYVKDINNILDKYVGTWKFSNSGNEIVIQLKKEVKYRIADNSSYEDLLVGEYKYIENGVEIVNTLPSFTSSSISGYDHSITGAIVLYELPNFCAIQSQNSEIKLELNIQNPTNHLIEGSLFVRYTSINGSEKLEMCINDGTTLSGNQNDRILIPDGLYVFTKQ